MKLIRQITFITIITAAAASGQQAPGQALGQLDFGREFQGPYGFSSPFMRDARQFDRLAPLGYPAAETREVLFSRARTLVARYEMQRARQRIYEQVDRMRRAFHRSSEFLAAKEAEDLAWADYQSAVASVLGRLIGDSRYQANSSLAAELAVQIQEMQLDLDEADHQGRSVDPNLVALARTKLRYASKISQQRGAALAGDPAVVEARAKLLVAGARTRQLRADFEDSVRDDDTVLALREKHDAARTNAVAAAAYESLARKLSRGVVHYAFTLMQNGRSHYDHGFFQDYGWPVYASYEPPAGNGPMEPIQNGYGFRRR